MADDCPWAVIGSKAGEPIDGNDSSQTRLWRSTAMSDVPSEGPSGRRVKRKHGLTRSKDGCLTCRKRRKKCNGENPCCAHCSRLGLDCVWPEPEVATDQVSKPRKRRTTKESQAANAAQALSARNSTSPTAELKSSEILFPDAYDDRNLSIQDAAQALFNGSQYDAQALVPVLPMAEALSQTFPGQLNLDLALPDLAAAPTREDLQAAQWLSGYRDEDGLRQQASSIDIGQDEIVDMYSNGTDAFQYSGEMPFEFEADLMVQSLLGPNSVASSPEEERRFFLHKSPFEDVDHDTRILLDYFETEFAQLISVAPRANNNLLRVFLPMAINSMGVRNAIAGWSATHLRDIDDKFTAQSRLYMGRAAECLELALQDPIKRDHDSTLAIALIICAVEVCKDTDTQWTKYRQIAHDIIKRRDLVHTYGGRDQIFLLKNFAYHDIMSSSPPVRNPTPHVESQIILGTIPSLDGPDCYMGIASPLYCLIAEITAMAAKIHVEKWDQRRIATHASRIIVMVDNAVPKTSELSAFKRGAEMRKNLTMFKILQLTAKLYINQVLLRYNPTSIGSQVLIQAVMPLFSNLGTVLVEMLFPLFIVGVDSLGENRGKVKRMLEIMDEKFRIGNLRCAYTVLEKCWESNMSGEEYVDWNVVAYNLFDQCITLA